MKSDYTEPNVKLMLLTIVLWFLCTWMLLIDTGYEFGTTVVFLMTFGFLSSHLSVVYGTRRRFVDLGFEVKE